MVYVFSIFSALYDWWQSLGPVGLAVAFFGFVMFTAVSLWLLCQHRSPVFWKRTDYYYFIFTVLGAAAGVADIAVRNWTKNFAAATS